MSICPRDRSFCTRLTGNAIYLKLETGRVQYDTHLTQVHTHSPFTVCAPTRILINVNTNTQCDRLTFRHSVANYCRRDELQHNLWIWKTDQTTLTETQWSGTQSTRTLKALYLARVYLLSLYKVYFLKVDIRHSCTACRETMHNQPQTASQTHNMHYSLPPKCPFFPCCSVNQSQMIILAIHHFENSFYKQTGTRSPGEQLKGSKNRMLRFCYSVMNILTESWSGWSASLC